MAGLFAGLTQGQWSDDPDRNEQARMGALLGASRAIDTYGKTGGQLLSQALGSFAEGQMGMRQMQMKERDSAADNAYRRAAAGSIGQEHAARIGELGLKIHSERVKAWQQQARAIAGTDQPLPMQPDPQESMAMASQFFTENRTNPNTQAPGGGLFAPREVSVPQLPPQNAPAGQFGPPAQPVAQSTPVPPQPSLLPGAAPQQAKTIDPNDPQGWAGISRQMAANAPAANADRLTLLNQELNAPGVTPQIRGLLGKDIAATGPAAPPQYPPPPAAPSPVPPPSVPTQAQQSDFGREFRRVQDLVRLGLATPEEVKFLDLYKGNQEKGVQWNPAANRWENGVGTLEAERQRLMQAAQIDVLKANPLAFATQAGKNAGDLHNNGARDVAYANAAATPITIPSSDPSRPSTLTTQGVAFGAGGYGQPSTAGMPGAVPGQQLPPGMPPPASGPAGIPPGIPPGIPSGMSADQISQREKVGQTYDRNKETFNKLHDEHQAKREAASAASQTMQAARNIMPKDTGKWEAFSLPYRQWIADTIGMNTVDTEKIFRAEGFMGLMSRALVGTQEEFKGSVSNVEFTTSQMTLPNMGNSREGNEFLLDFRQAAAEKQIWYAEQMARAKAEADAAEQRGERFNFPDRVNRINALRDSPATDIFSTEAMKRWAPKINRGQ